MNALLMGYREALSILSLNECPEGEDVVSWVMECESNARDFSPFEFTAKAFNETPDPERTWADYEEGLMYGAQGRKYHAEAHSGGYILTRLSDGYDLFLQPGDEAQAFADAKTNDLYTDDDVIAEYFVGVDE